ncbi:MAG: chorismate synthase [Crocinitomicaceae bacterium]|jgi:chorismate synthase|nr:chorismate synthase [Crocinitomicaceae bacterium]
MNQFGTLFRVSVFGESHGPMIGVTLDGVPSGISLTKEDFAADIARRKPGAKGTTPRVETDEPIIVSGVFNDRTTGAPLTILFENNNTRSKDYEKLREFPRPGHADFVASKKFKGFEDYRGGGHFSGRLTVLLVAAGVVAKKICHGVEIKGHIVEIAGEKDPEKGLQKAIDQKDSVGGIVECVVRNLPLGLGEPFFDSVESQLAHAAFAIPAIKGVEFGAGFAAARMFGVDHNDSILDDSGTTQTNHAGGIVGGISNGNDLIYRVAVKPTSSTPKEQQTLNVKSNQVENFSVKGRHDLCIALRVPVVLEATTAFVLADLLLQSKARN